jgi:hypothetical protein
MVLVVGVLLPTFAQASVFRALRRYPILNTANLLVDLAARRQEFLAQVYPLNAAAQAAWLFPSGEARAQALLAVAGELEGSPRLAGTMGWLASLAAKELGEPKNERAWSILARALTLRAQAGFADEVAALPLDGSVKDRVLGACAERLAKDGRPDSARKLLAGMKEHSLALDKAHSALAAGIARSGLRREALTEARLVENELWKLRAFRMVLEELAAQGFCRDLPDLALEAAGSLGRGNEQGNHKVAFKLLSELAPNCFKAKGQDEATWVVNRITDSLLRVKALMAIARDNPQAQDWAVAEALAVLPAINPPEARVEALLAVANVLMTAAQDLEVQGLAALPVDVPVVEAAPQGPAQKPGRPALPPAGAMGPQMLPAEAARIGALRAQALPLLTEAWELAPKVETTVVTSPRFSAILAQARWVDCPSAMTAARAMGEGLAAWAAMSSAALGCFKGGRAPEAMTMLSELRDEAWKDRTLAASAVYVARKAEWGRALGMVSFVADPFERLRLLAEIGVIYAEAGVAPNWSVQSVLTGLRRELEKR